MPSIILKKTWKVTSGSYGTDTYWTFHGGVRPEEINAVNAALARIRGHGKAGVLQFQLDSIGHYRAPMTHDYQKHNEEDGLVVILNEMERIGYAFRFQYDASFSSNKAFGGNSFTKQEMFIFHK